MSVLPLVNRIVRRVLEIPQRGWPILHTRVSTFDKEFGVETSQLVWLTNPFARNYEHGYRYEACDPNSCQWAIETSGINPREFCFIDIGCGKGRPLLIASRFDFPRLVGVDYSPKLCAQAERNLRQCGVEESRFQIICQDATEFAFPAQSLFVYLYNPFDGEILEQVLANLKRTADQGRIWLAFEGKGRHLPAKCVWLRNLAEGPNVVLYASD